MKILVLPKDSGNPYQAQLFTPMLDKGVRISYVRSLMGNPLIDVFFRITQMLGYRLFGYSIFHIHWVYPFGMNAKMRQSQTLNTCAYWCYILTLKSIKLLGYKLVWTAHNVLPHEPVFGDSRELKARRWLVDLADLVVAHSDSTINELEKIGLHPKKYTIIPHGSYVDVYQNNISKIKARQEFGLTDSHFVYLFLGQVRDYKGVDRLLEAYSYVRTENTILIIAGVCHDLDLRKLLSVFRDNSVIWHDGMIPDEKLQVYFNAADVVVLPFKKITTSGSALLALSFGRAVIVPALGDLAKLPSSVSYIYTSTPVNGLKESMIRAYSDKKMVREKGISALAYAKKLAWPLIAEKTQNAFRELFTD